MKKIKLGFAPTRRSIFSAPAAVEYADLTRKRLDELGIICTEFMERDSVRDLNDTKDVREI